VGFVFQYVGISYTTANRAALITNSNVAFTAFLSWSLYHEPMSSGNLLALPLSVLGLFLLVTGGDLTTLSGGQMMGDLLVLLAGLVWSFFLVINKDMVSRRSAHISQMVPWVMLVTTVGLAPPAFILGDVARVAVPWEGWVAVAYTAILCTVIPYWLFARAQRFVGATLSALVLLIEVVVAVIASGLILGEEFAIGSGLGAILVCVSIFLASMGSSSR
jgi:drug/metabolite transporter (DMT)-like permease